jgi:hypothetical protein
MKRKSLRKMRDESRIVECTNQDDSSYPGFLSDHADGYFGEAYSSNVEERRARKRAYSYHSPAEQNRKVQQALDDLTSYLVDGNNGEYNFIVKSLYEDEANRWKYEVYIFMKSHLLGLYFLSQKVKDSSMLTQIQDKAQFIKSLNDDMVKNFESYPEFIIFLKFLKALTQKLCGKEGYSDLVTDIGNAFQHLPSYKCVITFVHQLVFSLIVDWKDDDTAASSKVNSKEDEIQPPQASEKSHTNEDAGKEIDLVEFASIYNKEEKLSSSFLSKLLHKEFRDDLLSVPKHTKVISKVHVLRKPRNNAENDSESHDHIVALYPRSAKVKSTLPHIFKFLDSAKVVSTKANDSMQTFDIDATHNEVDMINTLLLSEIYVHGIVECLMKKSDNDLSNILSSVPYYADVVSIQRRLFAKAIGVVKVYFGIVKQQKNIDIVSGDGIGTTTQEEGEEKASDLSSLEPEVPIETDDAVDQDNKVTKTVEKKEDDPSTSRNVMSSLSSSLSGRLSSSSKKVIKDSTNNAPIWSDIWSFDTAEVMIEMVNKYRGAVDEVSLYLLYQIIYC